MPKITKQSRARLRTSLGDLTLEFLPEKAPRTVENFVKLAHDGFYEGLTFHRVIKGFMAQGGCPKGNGSGGPGYTIRPEFNDTPHVKGVVSMARSNDPHSGGSQFFICLDEARYLDSRYTAFARVVDGLEVLDKIGAVPVEEHPRFKEKSVPRDPIYINGVDLTGVDFEEDEGPASSKAPPAQEPQAAEEPSGGGKGRSRKSGGKQDAAAAEEDGPPAEGGAGEEKKARRPRRSRSTKSRSRSKDKDEE